MARQPGLTLLEALDADERMAGHYRLDAVRAHLLEMAGDREAAIAHYQAAAGRTASLPERNYLATKAARLRNRGDDVKITTVDDFVKHKVAPGTPRHREPAARADEEACAGGEGRHQLRHPRLEDDAHGGCRQRDQAPHHVRLFRGADFEDKYGLLQGVGKVSRHVKLTSLADVNATALRYYIKQAVAFERRTR